MLLRPDDDVYRVDAVWLGPQGLTLPWTARYTAYGIWLLLFVSILLAEALLPMRVSIPPVWEVVISILATYALTGVIDHERPVRAVWHLIRAEVFAQRAAPTSARMAARSPAPVRFSPSRVRIRESHARTTQAHAGAPESA